MQLSNGLAHQTPGPRLLFYASFSEAWDTTLGDHSSWFMPGIFIMINHHSVWISSMDLLAIASKDRADRCSKQHRSWVQKKLYYYRGFDGMWVFG